ncbi:MAG: PAS domain-containing protein [Calditrichaeota bacterium]|nr:PAS domain-containing protein [Calditrichota bacterium]
MTSIHSKPGEEEFKMILDMMPFAILVIDEYRNFYYGNQRYFELFGGTVEKAEKVSIEELLPRQLVEDENIVQRIQFLKEVFGENPQIMQISRYRLVLPDQQERFYRIHILPMPGEEGLLFMFILEDLTHSHDKEMSVLQQAKLLALGEMAAGIAHELNNFMSILMGHIELALVKNHDPAVEEHLEFLRNQVENISHFAASILKFSRQDPMEKQPVSLTEVVQETLRFIAARLRQNGIQVQLQLAPDVPRIYANKSQLQQLLINLLLNAKRAMPDGGHIIIRVHAEKDVASMEIIDSGEGIPVDIQKKIFNPFFTTRKDGWGLGLNICQKIVRNHQGRLSFESRQGQGTVFRVELPVGTEITRSQ